ncbi:MAG TPA: DUF4386 family protein [Pyrinomonadaceae bacterium]|nr:DUF4386 family protein [Pyrinomonadaceae bacterium]
MSAGFELMGLMREMSPRLLARIAGGIYLLVFVAGVFSLFVRRGVGVAAAAVAGALYIAVTVLFYFIFKPVNRSISLVAAIISLLGISIGPLTLVIRSLSVISPLVFFGFYCLLIGYLIFKSGFLPHVLGALMLFAGLGWLTFLWPSLDTLRPYNFLPASSEKEH